jgi:hypothetical protein
MRHMCGQGSGKERCGRCRRIAVRMINQRSELAFLRRQFKLLRDRCDKLLRASEHSGGGKFF